MGNKLSNIELFDGMTLDIIFKHIFERSTEERNKALEVFDNIAERLTGPEDVLLIGDKANPYLDIAQKSTDNLTKMLVAAQRILELEVTGLVDRDSILNAIDSLDNALPDKLKNRNRNIAQATKDDDEKDGFTIPDFFERNNEKESEASSYAESENAEIFAEEDEHLELKIDIGSEEKLERYKE